MHIPDGFINAPVSLGAGLLAVGTIAVALKQARGKLESEVAPMAGLAAVFIFAVQMLNFPIVAGTSGHLLGGALAAILIGRWAGLLALTVVLSLQALIFADGGLSALGLNLVNMGIITVLGGWFVFRLVARVLPKTHSGVVLASGIAAFATVPLSALGFVVQYALGGTGTFETASVLTAMVSVHVLIGIGEGVITALTIGAVLATRPDLVYGARELLPKTALRIKTVEVKSS
jgi:cobalt/nickel transport system permease protein